MGSSLFVDFSNGLCDFVDFLKVAVMWGTISCDAVLSWLDQKRDQCERGPQSEIQGIDFLNRDSAPEIMQNDKGEVQTKKTGT